MRRDRENYVTGIFVLAAVCLMLNLPVATWLRFAIWMLVGLAVYFGYGRGHSRLR